MSKDKIRLTRKVVYIIYTSKKGRLIIDKKYSENTKKIPKKWRFFYIFLSKLSNFFETSRLSFEFTDKSNVFSSNLERSKDLDLGNSWGIDRENLLDSDTVNILTNSDSFIESCFSMSLDNQTLELLDTFFISFFDNLVYFHLHTS